MESILKALKQDKKIPDIRPGDIVRVYQKIKEGGKEREQAFEGAVIQKSGGSGPAASFVVRRISQGIGIERKFLIQSPLLTKVQVKKRSKVKRANLSYLRNTSQVAKKLKDRKIAPFEESLIPETEKKEVIKKQEEEKKEKQPETKKEPEKNQKSPDLKDKKGKKK